MDDPYLDSRSSRRVWEERPRGPFEVNEPLPKPVQLWKASTNMATNKQQELLHFKWQRNAAQRVLESLELHSYEWTVKAIKTRECLDKLDRRDVALSTFAMSRGKNINTPALELRDMDLTRAEDNTAELRAEAARNTRLLQIGRIDEMVMDDASIIEETDRAALLSIAEMDATELQIYLKMVGVYDLARSHFLFDIVDPQVKRYLNAERLKAEALNPPLVLSYNQYKQMLLARTQNSELTQDLLNYILKPREEGCPVYLWVAERTSESNLLTANGLMMSNQAWLAYTIAFITAEERLVLHVPSLQERAAYDGGRGYELVDLEDAISHMDVTTLKPFRQAACLDPVAQQIVKLSKGLAAESSSSSRSRPQSGNRYPPRKEYPRKEGYSAELGPKKGKGKGRSATPYQNRTPPDMTKLDQVSNLPHKDGKIDMEQYAKYKDGGLRQKLHDAIRARKCIRCMAVGHLRSACTEPPKSWEADFNAGKAAFWGPKAKQVRPQWLPSAANLRGREPRSKVLFVNDAGRSIALDTCSEISIGQRKLLLNLRLAEKAILIEGVGGMVLLEEEGDFLLADSKKITVFAVGQSNLPPKAQILLGIEHLKALQVSLDFAMLHPDCELNEAMAHGKVSLSRVNSLLLDRNSGSYGCLSDVLSFSKTLTTTFVCLLFVCFCSLFQESNWSVAAISSLPHDLNPIHLFFEMALLLGLFLFAEKGLELSRQSFSLTVGLARASLPRMNPQLPLNHRSCLARMHGNEFASVFAPQPSHLLRGNVGAWGERPAPFHWRTEHFNRSRPEPAPLRPDRLGGFGRAARFGKFRTPGSSREPLFTLPPRGRGYTSFPPRTNIGRGSKYDSLRQWPKRPNPESKDRNPRAGSKRTKPNPSPALKAKRSLPPPCKCGRISESKRSKMNRDSRQMTSPSSPPRREAVIGRSKSLEHGYPPPERRGHRLSPEERIQAERAPRVQSQTEEARRDMFYHVPIAEALLPHPELDLNVQRAAFEALSSVATISEKFSLLSQPRSRASSDTLKRCFSMHIVRGYVARGLDKRERKRRDSSYRPPLGRTTPSSSTNSSPETILVPRPQWIRDAQPDLSDDEADAAWRRGNEKLYGEGIHLTSHPDVSSFTGGNTLKVMAEVFHPQSGLQQERIALDTQSDVTTCLREHLSDVHPIIPDEVSGIGGSSTFAEEGTLFILSKLHGQRVGIPALVASQCQLPSGCIALLGVSALLELEVAVDKHLRLPQFSPLVCHLGEKKLREWLIHHPETSIDTKPFDINAIQICPDLSPEQIQEVKAVIRKYEKVFEGHENSLPKPFATEPITLKFKPDAKPQSVPQPRWTLAQKEIVTRWAEEGLRNGSLEPSTSAWSSRVHLVLKPPSNTTADLADLKDCKLRPCGDYRLVNTQIQKIAPNLPTGLHQLEQASGFRIYFEADSVACYHSFRLAAGLSREALAVWTPIGLLQPTVLPFGQKNSGTEAQGPYLLAAKKLKQVSNYVDDWLGYASNFNELLKNFGEFLAVCLEHNITLNTSKTKFGFSSAQFFGFKVDVKGTRLADKHICPIRNMVPPTDISELRRTLGLFVVSRKYLQHYAVITKPLTDLLKGKLPVFKWEQAQQDAYEYVREALLAGIHLAAPNFELPFHLQTDASEDGKGGVLYQLSHCPIEEQFPYCKDKHAPTLMDVIAYFSKAWTDSQRLRPPFYLEADSLLWATDESKFYALSSPFPLYTYSDHMPLSWMRKSEKGPVSQFLIEQLSELETEHQYIQGHLNSVADATSRYPLLGPKRLAPRGLANSVQEVLSRLPDFFRGVKTIHVHAGTYTADLKVIVQTWTSGNKGDVQPVAPTKRGRPLDADLAIMIPRPEDSPITLALYLMSSIPFAILIPNDLLSESFADKIYPEANVAAIKARFLAAGKLQILVTQMTWVLGNIPACTKIEMFSQTLSTAAPITGIITDANQSSDNTFDEPVPITIEDWMIEQRRDPAFLIDLETIPNIACRDGLYLHAPDGQPPRIVVPPQTQEALIRFTHERMFHLGHAKVADRLSKSYFWPTLRRDVRRIVTDCPECELEKARQSQAHGLFRARPHDAPRSRYAMDFQGQGTAITGEQEALGIIDTTTRFVTVIALPNRRVQTFLQPFMDHIVFRHGPPAILHCDEAPEFMSEMLGALADITETAMTTTMAHNARSNGIIEVFWRYWNRCMRLLPDDQYKQWPKFVSRIVFAYNTASHQSIGGISPYEIDHGVPARDVFSQFLTAPTDDLQQLPTEDGDIENARLFALAVRTSTTAFVQLAKNHDQYVKDETAARLNEKGFPRAFVIGAMVKARFPPTKTEMDATGRQAVISRHGEDPVASLTAYLRPRIA